MKKIIEVIFVFVNNFIFCIVNYLLFISCLVYNNKMVSFVYLHYHR